MATAQSKFTDLLMVALPLWEADNIRLRTASGTTGSIYKHSFTRIMDGVIQMDHNNWQLPDCVIKNQNINSGASIIFTADIGNHQLGNPNALPAKPGWVAQYTRWYFIIPADVAPGDTFVLGTGWDPGADHQIGPVTAADDDPGAIYFNGNDLTPVLPRAKPAAGLGDQNDPTGGVKPPFRMGTPAATAPVYDRMFVIYENRDAAHGGGRLITIAPNSATGLPLPSFRMVTTLPATGTTVGEAIINQNSGLSYVWDGGKWAAIVPPTIVPYATDAAVLADTVANPGTYAFSRSTGNLFVRYNDGTNNVWREVGIMKFPTEAGLLTATPGDGSLAFASDTKNFWVRTGTKWEPAGHTQDTEANILSSTPMDGVIAYATDQNRFWFRANGAWIPFGVYLDTEANIIGSAYGPGTICYATDTNQYLVNINGAWQPLDIIVDTEANILAKTPRDGTRAYSTDTNVTWDRIAGAWQPSSIIHTTNAAILASTYANGTRCYATDTNMLYLRINGVWTPNSYLTDTEANIRAATPVNGLIAVSTDTGKLFYGDGAAWIGQPFRDYATEAALLVDTPPDNVVAVSVDTGRVFYRTGGNWVNLNGSNVPSGNTDPAGAAAGNTQGDMFFNLAANQLKVWDGVAWKSTGAGAINGLSDVDTATTPPKKGEVLKWDDTAKKWMPAKSGGGLNIGAEPTTKTDGLMWWDGVRLWIWNATPGVWVQA